MSGVGSIELLLLMQLIVLPSDVRLLRYESPLPRTDVLKGCRLVTAYILPCPHPHDI